MNKVAIIKTTPQTVLEDIQKVSELSSVKDTLDNTTTNIIKNNLFWNLIPIANTTPW